MIELRAPYQARPIRFLHLTEHQGWRLKVYGIRFRVDGEQSEPDQQIIERAEREMLTLLPQPAVTERRHGVGFLIIHQGQHRNWLLLDWWYDQEILKQHLFSSPLTDPANISRAESDLLACTWEMAVHCFERQAWLETVLQNESGPDIEAYLGQQLNADV